MRSWLVLLLLSAVLVVLCPSAVLAVDESPPAEERKDMFSWALDLGVWTIVVFLGLLFILTRYAWKPMLEGLEQRERTIAAAVEDAKKAREEAAELRRQMAEERQRAHDEVRRLIEEARRDAERLAEERKAQADAAIEADRERLRREIAIARDQALKEIMTQAAQLATLISSKVIRRQLTVEDHRALVDEALADMNRAIEQRRKALAGEGTA
jgi:F-type H+-transporting ATPase subunit b